MRLSERDKKLLLILAGILIFIAGYVGVFSRYLEKNGQLKTEIAALQPEVDKMQEYLDNLEDNKEKIEKNKRIYDRQMKEYPNDVRAEDQIMFARDMEEDLSMFVGSANFTVPESFLEITGVEMLSEDEYQSQEQHCYVYKTDIQADCDLSYDAFKKSLKYVYNYPKKTTIDSVNIGYSSEDGKLEGEMVLSRYFITGRGDGYVPTIVPSIPMGTPNIFNSVE